MQTGKLKTRYKKKPSPCHSRHLFMPTGTERKERESQKNTYVLHADFHTNILSLILTEIRERSGRIRSEPLIVYFDLSPKFNGFSLLCFPPLPFLPSFLPFLIGIFKFSLSAF